MKADLPQTFSKYSVIC